MCYTVITSFCSLIEQKHIISKKKNVNITHFFKNKSATSASTMEDNDRATEENKNRITVDSSELSLLSKEKNELNIF